MSEGAGEFRASPDNGFMAARMLEDYEEAARQLLGLTVWLPVTSEQQSYLVAQRDNGQYVRAYTRPGAISALASADVDPEHARPYRFADLVKRWNNQEVGLVINPDTDTEFRIPADVIPNLLNLYEPPQYEPSEPDTKPLVQADLPQEVGGFRLVAMVDGVDDGKAVLSEERGTVDDPEERTRIQEYLFAGTVIQALNGYVTDVVDPAKGSVVPAHSRTDGRWIWSDGVGYYLAVYGIALEPDFYRAIRDNDYTCPTPSESTLEAAGRALEEQQYMLAEQYQRQQQQDNQ